MSDMSSDTAMPSIENKSINGSTGLENAKNAVVNNTSAAASAVASHPATQSVTNGPVAENVKDQHAKTQAEFSNLAASRTTPATLAATGQQLTHYHSFFASLLSWNNPRASGIAYASIVVFIFAARYLDILRYAFKVTYLTLTVTVLAEVIGKLVISQGLTSQFRPRKYYTVSKSTLDSLIGDVHELINFFVIESQRIVFAENVFFSAAALVGSFSSYYLIKVVPFWGLSLITSTVLFLAPLLYKTNKELIDHYLTQAADIANQQTKQVREIASHHAARATETTKQYVGDYSHKAQEMIGSARGRSSSPTVVKAEPAIKKENVTSTYKTEDFPAAPKDEFKAPPSVEAVDYLKSDKPLIAA
ncbi:Reticulon-domain-containing protein [Amylocarpus encephaloides]|uniref:Reticulon-like protein n=1 Tax=Amylocarpus encephaloides TaxID=45428 RepID=A0A9P7YK90_9HELO|nr:Reticulon-domain-containing protein [Amylocarpus encephaloides]